MKVPDKLPYRAQLYIKLASLWWMYEKLPWELGYPHYEEFDNILPFMMSEIGKKRKRDEEVAKDYEDQKKEMAGVK